MVNILTKKKLIYSQVFLHGVEENLIIGLFNEKEKKLTQEKIIATAKVIETKSLRSSLQFINTAQVFQCKQLFKAKIIRDHMSPLRMKIENKIKSQTGTDFSQLEEDLCTVSKFGNETEYKVRIDGTHLSLHYANTNAIIFKNPIICCDWFVRNVGCVLWEDHLKNCVMRYMNDEQFLSDNNIALIPCDKIRVSLVKTNFEQRTLPLYNGSSLTVPIGQRFYLQIENNYDKGVYITLIEFDCNKQVNIVEPCQNGAQEAILPKNKKLVGVSEEFSPSKPDNVEHVNGIFSIPENACKESNGDSKEMMRFIFTLHPVDFSAITSPGINTTPELTLERVNQSLENNAITRGGEKTYFAVIDVYFNIIQPSSCTNILANCTSLDSLSQSSINPHEQATVSINNSSIISDQTNSHDVKVNKDAKESSDKVCSKFAQDSASNLLQRLDDAQSKNKTSFSEENRRTLVADQKTKQEIEILLSAAKEAYSSKNFYEAIDLYDEALRLDPTNSSLYLGRALCYYNTNAFANAFKDAIKATELDKKNIGAWQLRAECAKLTANYEDALFSVQIAFALDYNDATIITLTQQLIIHHLSELTRTELITSDDEFTLTCIQNGFTYFDDFDSLSDENLRLMRRKGFAVWLTLNNQFDDNKKCNDNKNLAIVKTQLVDLLPALVPICDLLDQTQTAALLAVLTVAYSISNKEDIKFSADCYCVADFYTRLGNLKLASTWIKRAINEVQSNKSASSAIKKKLLTRFYALQTKVCSLKGKYIKALECGFPAKSLAETSGNLHNLVLILLSLGNTLYQLGRYDEATAELLNCINLCGKVGDMNTSATAYFLLSFCYTESSNCEKALEYLDKSYKLIPSESQLIQVSQARASIYFELATIQKNNKVEAIKYRKLGEQNLSTVLQLIEKMPLHLQVDYLSNQAHTSLYLFLHSGNYQTVENLCKKLLNLNPRKEISAILRTKLGLALFGQDNFEDSLLEIERAETLFSDIENELHSDQNIITWRHQASIFQMCTVLQWIFYKKNLPFDSIAAADRYRARSLQLHLVSKYGKKLAKLTADDIKNQLQNIRTHLIVYFSYYKNVNLVICWVYTRNNGTDNGHLKCYSSDELQSTDNAIENKKNIQECIMDLVTRSGFGKIKQTKSQINKQNNYLNKFLYNCIKENLPKEENHCRILIIPDDELWRVQYSNLTDSTNANPLVNSCIISFALSLSTITIHQKNVMSKKLNLIVGYPKQSSFAQQNDLRELPMSKKECEQVKEKCDSLDAYNSIMYLTGNQATVENVCKHLQFCKLLHVACHAFMMKNEILPDALVLCNDTNNTNDDGLLKAKTIQKMDLSGIELVFLNCCYEGKVYSEGLISLGRSFIFAGAKSVVFSTAAVQDHIITCEFVDSFYDKFVTTRNAEEALCYAQRLAAEKQIDSKFWSSYIVLKSS